jgi:hypothetical protein
MDAGEWRDWERLIDDRGIVIDRPHGQVLLFRKSRSDTDRVAGETLL